MQAYDISIIKKIEILLLNGGKVVRENLRGENESIT